MDRKAKEQSNCCRSNQCCSRHYLRLAYTYNKGVAQERRDSEGAVVHTLTNWQQLKNHLVHFQATRARTMEGPRRLPLDEAMRRKDARVCRYVLDTAKRVQVWRPLCRQV